LALAYSTAFAYASATKNFVEVHVDLQSTDKI